MKFLDNKLNKKLARDGYVVLDLYSEAEINKLRSIFESKQENYPKDKDISHSVTDLGRPDLVEYLDKEIQKIVCPKLDSIFESYEYLMSAFLTKEPGEKNITIFHQDPTLIENNTGFVSVGLWIPLQDTNTENGCLRLVKGSHRFGNVLVVTPNFPTVFNKFYDKVSRFADPVELKVGQIVMFDNKLIHGAFANKTNSRRIAIATALKSKGCDWVYHHIDGNSNKIGKYLMNYEAYVKHKNGKKPIAKFLGYVSHEFEEKNYSEFLSFMFKNYPLDTMKNLLKPSEN